MHGSGFRTIFRFESLLGFFRWLLWIKVRRLVFERPSLRPVFQCSRVVHVVIGQMPPNLSYCWAVVYCVSQVR